MASTVALLTAEEFEHLPEVPGLKRELLEGVIHEMASGGQLHEVAKSNANEILSAYCQTHREFRLFVEAMSRLGVHDDLIPALSIRLRAEARIREETKPFAGAPYLAVEVVSSEKADFLEAKIRAYRRKGARSVWLVFPKQRSVRVFRGRLDSNLRAGGNSDRSAGAAGVLLPGR